MIYHLKTASLLNVVNIYKKVVHDLNLTLHTKFVRSTVRE